MRHLIFRPLPPIEFIPSELTLATFIQKTWRLIESVLR